MEPAAPATPNGRQHFRKRFQQLDDQNIANSPNGLIGNVTDVTDTAMYSVCDE